MNVDLPTKSGTGLRDEAVLAWLRMARIVSRTHREAGEKLKNWGISNAQFDVIAHISASAGLTQQELADRLFVTQGNVCQLLNGLEGKGLVERRRQGRKNHLHLTGAGQDLAAEVVPQHEHWQAGRLGALTEAEQQELLRLLRKLDRSQQTNN